ncbi:hypothetical protein DPMN_035578 [Dreissena polymorpha]|uniref:Uncharacterized protein n=1 Tax=Dreissena polymorpha TaxID=45954 RepID=A0A9D4M7J3_DREPO|nr:hypothetical protein DPMN_035578 [Dreissena polymorpha]
METRNSEGIVPSLQRDTKSAFLALEIDSFVRYNCGTGAVTAFVFLDDFIFKP